MDEKKTRYGVMIGGQGSYRFGVLEFLPGLVVPIPAGTVVPAESVRTFEDKKAAEKFAKETNQPPPVKRLI